jgi:hypothetical protein
MMRKLVARSILVVAFVAIIGLLWHDYGPESLHINIPKLPFHEHENAKSFAGELRAGPLAGDYRALEFDSQHLHAVYFSSSRTDSPEERGPEIFINGIEVAGDKVVTNLPLLDLFVQKHESAPYGAFSYEVKLARHDIVEAEALALSEGDTLVHAIWTRKDDKLGTWTLKLKGGADFAAKAQIMVAPNIPVISKYPLDISSLPMVILGIESATGSTITEEVCLDFRLANRGYDKISSAAKFLPPVEVDLAGAGDEITMQFDKKERDDRSAGSCRNSRNRPDNWSSMTDEARLDWYRKLKLVGLETILVVRRDKVRTRD